MPSDHQPGTLHDADPGDPPAWAPELARGAGAELARLRATVDQLDDQLVMLLHRRAEAVQELGRLKASLGLPLVDPAREQEILQRAASQAAAGPFAPDVAVAVLTLVIAHCRDVQLLRGLASPTPVGRDDG
ncbi:MAG: chorismate mutase [Myxococcota bacterium]|jgi:chorismate mutase|nr:chorismate mutase [Myxococcota bacterium]